MFVAASSISCRGAGGDEWTKCRSMRSAARLTQKLGDWGSRAYLQEPVGIGAKQIGPVA